MGCCNYIYNDSSFEQQPTESNANVVPDIEPHVIISSNVPESIYTLQKLKFYGVEDVKIKKAINDLFHKNIRIDE